MARGLVGSIHPLVQNVVLLSPVCPPFHPPLSLCRILMDTFSCYTHLFAAN